MDWRNSTRQLPPNSDKYYLKVMFENGEQEVITGDELHFFHKSGRHLDWKPFLNSKDIYEELTRSKGGTNV